MKPTCSLMIHLMPSEQGGLVIDPSYIQNLLMSMAPKAVAGLKLEIVLPRESGVAERHSLTKSLSPPF